MLSAKWMTCVSSTSVLSSSEISTLYHQGCSPGRFLHCLICLLVTSVAVLGFLLLLSFTPIVAFYLPSLVALILFCCYFQLNYEVALLFPRAGTSNVHSSLCGLTSSCHSRSAIYLFRIARVSTAPLSCRRDFVVHCSSSDS